MYEQAVERRPVHTAAMTCEHLHGTLNGLRPCDQTARWRISSAIKVIIGYYCDAHVPRMWPGWRKESITQ